MYPFPLYVYPDGTKSVRKPKDGEIFHTVKNHTYDSSWQYDDVMGKWVNITNKPNQNAVAQSQGYYIPPDSNSDSNDHWSPYSWEPKCECGADAVNHPGHSYWCRKYTGKP